MKYNCDVYFYRIYWLDNEDSYVGHTIGVSQRMINHHNPTKIQNALINQKIRINPNFKHEILEIKWCRTRKDACKIEKKWWKELGSNLNMKSPFVTEEEFKAQRKKYMKEYLSRPDIKTRRSRLRREGRAEKREIERFMKIEI